MGCHQTQLDSENNMLSRGETWHWHMVSAWQHRDMYQNTAPTQPSDVFINPPLALPGGGFFFTNPAQQGFGINSS